LSCRTGSYSAGTGGLAGSVLLVGVGVLEIMMFVSDGDLGSVSLLSAAATTTAANPCYK